MSLTHFLNTPDVRARFRREFHVPPTHLTANLLAPPVTKHFGLVGTAFDYLLRFYVEQLNAECIKQAWVAEHAVRLIHDHSDLFSQIKTQADELLETAKQAYKKYLENGQIDNTLVRSTLALAQLDTVFRSGIVGSDFGNADEGDIADLKQLIGIVPADQFKANNVCALNPTFGIGSELVGGADADLLIDDVLLDIKTTKDLSLSQEYYNQLVGYYILSKIGGEIGSLREGKVGFLGVYFSRYATVHTISIRTIESNPHFQEFIDWFRVRAKQEYPNKRSL